MDAAGAEEAVCACAACAGEAIEDPAVLATFEKYDQTVVYMNTETYTKWARETYEADARFSVRVPEEQAAAARASSAASDGRSFTPSIT